MKLYYAPGACSIGIHVLMEEIGKPYEAVKLDTKSGENTRPPFIDLNPKGKVPTVQRDDGTVLTEYPVIAHYLAETNPGAGLLPKDGESKLRARRRRRTIASRPFTCRASAACSAPATSRPTRPITMW